MAFIDDRLAMPSRYGDSYAEAVEHGVRAVKLDLVPIITAMGPWPRRTWGLGATYSTTYYAPLSRGAPVLPPWTTSPAAGPPGNVGHLAE